MDYFRCFRSSRMSATFSLTHLPGYCTILGIMKSDKRIKDRPEAVGLYESGLSVQEVAEFYGITRQAMWEWLKSRGVKMRQRERFGKENHFHRGGIRASDRAQNVLEKAIKKGIVGRSSTCETCGCRGIFKDGRTAIQAHHTDYNKPLDVMWLCQKCHHEWHKNFKAIERR